MGKAKSIRKRVASHFSNPSTRGVAEMLQRDRRRSTSSPPRPRPRRCSPSRTSSSATGRASTSGCATTSRTRTSRSRSTRTTRGSTSRARSTARNRAYFGPFSNAKRVRETLDLLGKIFQHRTCDGKEPGRASGSPCLDYFIKRCQAPCVGYVSKEEYRENIDTIVAFLSGRYRQIERELEQSMKLRRRPTRSSRPRRCFRNRLQAVRSLLERQRITNESVGTLDAIAVAAEETDANAQVFQVRDGVLADRQSFYLENAAGRDEAEVLEEFVLQYYASAMAIPPRVVVPRGARATPSAARRGARRAPRRARSRSARRARRQAADLRARRAQRAARARPGPAALRAPPHAARRGARGPAAGARAWSQLPMRIECFDISNLGETHTVASMVVFEGGAPKKSDYRRFKIRERGAGRLRRDGRGAVAARWPSSAPSASSRRTRRSTTRASPRCRR